MGAVYGQAVGDALGVPYEFSPRGTFDCTGMIGHGSHSQPAGTWSDDTAMMLATLDSLADHYGQVDTDNLRAKYVAWARNGEYTPDGVVFDIGTTTGIALGQDYGCDGYWDNGNGALMRILPLAFTGATDDDIRKASAVTHAHEISMDACVRFVHAARMLIAKGEHYDPKIVCELAGLDDMRGIPVEKIKSGTFVLDTLQAAVWCLVNTSSYKDCVLKAVNLGEDTDTTAAVAGGLAGILYGLDANPWKDRLRGSEKLEMWVTKAAYNMPPLKPWEWIRNADPKVRKLRAERDDGLQELVQLIPEFQKAMDEHRKLYHWNDMTKDERGIYVYRGITYDPIVDRYWHAIYKAWADNGDYHEWLEDLNLENPTDLAEFYGNGDYDTLDLDSTLALLLIPTRQERFGDGSLCGYLDDGIILALLRHVREIIKGE
ncbi:ADP-ribosylglycohydrolase family protein [Bifidobacterium sp. SO1]|nr:ADP-ribosylglycohydrolase family protein [Bifidobacterium sp. SO1]